MNKRDLVEKFELSLLSNGFTVDNIKNIVNILLVDLNDYSVQIASKELIPYVDELEELVNKYIGCMIINGKSKATVHAYVNELKRFFKVCNKPVKEITVMDIRSYLAMKMTDGSSKRSVFNYKNYLSSFFNWLVEEGEIESNPVSGVGKIKFEKEIKEPFTEVELDLIRNSKMSIRNRAIIEVLLSSGIRVNELCNLNRNDIDLSSLKVHVRCGKGAKDRITFINRVASFHLNNYLNSRTDLNEALFLSHTNRDNEFQERITPVGVRKMLKSIEQKTGVHDIHPHKFRHSFATKLRNNGMDINEIQKLLGHSNISTTLIYISTNDDQLEQSYKKYIV